MTFTRSLVAMAAVTQLVILTGCGDSAKPYSPKPAWSGTPVALPDVPTIPARPVKVGDAYTVWGASHHLRSIVHVDDVKNKDISIIGWVVKTNFADAPACAVHPTGKADPDGCNPPVPAFWIADEKGDTKNAMKDVAIRDNIELL